MKSRLFEDLVVSVAGRRARGGLALPLSMTLHAAGVAALLALPALTTEALPDPPARPIHEPVVLTTVRIAPPSPPAKAPPVRRPPAGRRTAPAATVVSTSAVDARPKPNPDATLLPDAEPDTRPTDGRMCLGCTIPADPGPDTGTRPGPGGTDQGAGPIRVSSLIRPPTKVREARPVYPEIAKLSRVQGLVLIECIIAPDGRVENVRVVSGHPLLQEAALDAVRQWRYTPSMLNGVPVSVIMTVTVNFILS